ncbi:MAG: hypothetical protein ABGX16_06405 [Pirellulales bacterium]
MRSGSTATGGLGTSLFLGSYDAFLDGPGGGSLDLADLSTYGVDAANNQAWAVLDHASVFALGLLTDEPSGDFDRDGDVDGADFLKWQRGEVTDPPSAFDLDVWQA